MSGRLERHGVSWLVRKGLRFGIAAAKLAGHGGKLLEPEQIEKRLKICVACPHFRETECAICGCKLNNKKKLMNKVAFPTERCPDKPPRWIEE